MSKFPKKSRKLTLSDGTEWRWRYGTPMVYIWDPDGKRHEVRLKDLPAACWQDWDYEAQGTVNPGDIRKYIENNIIEKPLVYQLGKTAIPGKLYVYRHKTVGSGPVMAIEEISGGDGWVQAKRRLIKLFETKHPLLLLDCRVNVFEKRSYHKFLIEEIICTLRFEHPRTWRGSFALHEEWAAVQEGGKEADSV